MLAPWKKSYDQPRQHIKKLRHHFAKKGPFSQGYGFSSSHAWMWELDPKEGWALKNLCFWTVVLEKTLESPLDCKEIQPVHSEGDQTWTFIGRNDAEAETPILWLPNAKSWLVRKDPEAGKDWKQEDKGMMEASLSFITSQSLLKPMSIESVIPSNHLIPCCPLLLLPSIFLSIRVFSNESFLPIRLPKYWSLSFSSKETHWI